MKVPALTSTELQVVALAGSVLVSSGAMGVLWSLGCSEPVRVAVQRYVAELDRRLGYLQRPVRGSRVLQVQLTAAGGLLLACAAQGSPAPLLLLPVLTVLPSTWLDRATAQRTTGIEQQLDGWLLSLSNALRANPSLGEGLAASAQLMGEPLSSELALVLKEHRLGTPLDRALRTMAGRVRSPVVSAAVVALRIARNAGGDLNRTLEVTAASLREMARLEGVIRTKTAEGRAQSAVIALVPAFLFVMLDQLDPELVSPLLDTARGHALLGVAAVLWLAALLWARRIVAVDI